MALVSLPRVGTSTHTLNLTVQGNQITAFFDGSQVASVTDTNIDGLAPYTSGAAGAHMYMDGAFVANFDDLSITQIILTNTAPVLPAQPNRTIAAQTTLLVTNTATDTDVPTQALTYQLISPPAGAAINLSGLISWTPTAAQAPSSHHHPQGDDQDRSASELVKVVREATARFRDVSVAEAEGYKLQFGCVSGPDAGAMGLPFVNMSLVGDGKLDATRPDIEIPAPA